MIFPFLKLSCCNEEIKIVVLYSMIAFSFGISLNVGHYFIELIFKPIKKEYFINKLDKFFNLSNITTDETSSNYSPNILSLNDEPLISNKR